MPERGKTILILGNGFDLAHGLPTKYSHFLEFCLKLGQIKRLDLENGVQVVARYEKGQHTNQDGKKLSLTDDIAVFCKDSVDVSDVKEDEVILDNEKLLEIESLLYDNVWYLYFINLCSANCIKGENWIDFESEIRFIIKEADEYSSSLTYRWQYVIDKAIKDSESPNKWRIFDRKIWTDKYMQKKGWKSDYNPTMKEFREKAFEDLERLTRALELYLAVFVEKIPINKKISEISNLSPDYVINFNYTDTYERIYKKGEVYHIHGKADANRPAENNDMVLGIDEYWIGDEQDERTNFTIFKKFAQRIQKHTGNESYKYLMEMQKLFKANKDRWSGNVDINNTHPNGVSYVYVFGHSLDITDKDILSGFIGDDATSVTVYCMDKGTEGELIVNTIKLITEKRLLEKVNHVPTKLKYIIP